MGYKSAAQRKAVHASKADGGKGNPNKMKVKGFDVKSKKAKNKRNYNKAIDLNADRYGPSATQSKFTFKAQPERDFSMHNISARKTDGTIKQQEKMRKKSSPTRATSKAAKNLLKAVPNKKAYDKLSDIDKKGFNKAARKAGLPTKKSPTKKGKKSKLPPKLKYTGIDPYTGQNLYRKETTGLEKMPQLKAKKLKTSPALAKLSASCKSAARRKFDVYPSAYANMWASKTQKAGKC